jgi:hypothetical protein
MQATLTFASADVTESGVAKAGESIALRSFCVAEYKTPECAGVAQLEGFIA